MATETVPPTVVIDLGLDRGEPETYGRPTRSTTADWFRPFLVVLFLLVVASASAAPAKPALTELISLPVGPADSYTVTADGRLVAQTDGTLSSYDLGTGRQEWRTGLAAPTFRLRSIDGVVLVRPWASGPGQLPVTSAVDVRTGRERWQRTGSVMTIAGASTLLAVTPVRSVATVERHIQGEVQSLDPITGRTRWSVPIPSTATLLGVPGPAGGPPRMLLVHDNGTMAVYDLATGERRALTGIPPADYGPDDPIVSGGLILLRHGIPGRSVISAYDPVTLGLRWQRPAGSATVVEPCRPLACLAGADGVEGVDPATGAIAWYRPAWTGVEMRGNLLMAYASPSGTGESVGLADPATGRVVTDLNGWEPMTGVVNPGSENEVLVSRTVDDGARSMVAIARPGVAQPDLISDLPAGTGVCQSVPGRLICQSAGGRLVVWAYQPKG